MHKLWFSVSSFSRQFISCHSPHDFQLRFQQFLDSNFSVSFEGSSQRVMYGVIENNFTSAWSRKKRYRSSLLWIRRGKPQRNEKCLLKSVDSIQPLFLQITFPFYNIINYRNCNGSACICENLCIHRWSHFLLGCNSSQGSSKGMERHKKPYLDSPKNRLRCMSSWRKHWGITSA